MRKATSWVYMFLVTLALFSVSGLNAVAQNQYYVAATGGSDSNSGTSIGSPWATCNHAMAAATLNSVGAVINFIASNSQHAGCTAVNRNVAAPARLAMRCTAPWTSDGHTVLSPHCRMNGPFLVRTANRIDIGANPFLGFEYTNPGDNTAVDVISQCPGNAGACGFGNSIHVFGNFFHDIGQTNGNGCPSSGGILITNAHGVSVTDAQVIGNVIDHIGIFPGPPGNQMHGIYVSTMNGQVYNNVVTRACYAGLQYYDQACNARVSNNVFANNTVGMVYYGSHGCTAGLNTGDNNVLVNNTQQAINNSFSGDQGCTPGRQMLYSNNIISGNGVNGPTHAFASCTTVQNQKSENPTTTFVSYTGSAQTSDFHLKAGSQAIGGGTSQCASGGLTPCVPSVDIAGNAFAGQIGAFASGSPIPTGLLTPTSITFADTFTGVTSNFVPITVHNTSGVAVVFSSIVASTHFALVTSATPCPIGGGGLAAGGMCEVDVTFSPNSATSFSGTVTFTDNFVGTPASPQTVALSGNGTTPSAPSAPTGVSVVVH